MYMQGEGWQTRYTTTVQSSAGLSCVPPLVAVIWQPSTSCNSQQEKLQTTKQSYTVLKMEELCFSVDGTY